MEGERCSGIRKYFVPKEMKHIEDRSPIKGFVIAGVFIVVNEQFDCTMLLSGNKCALMGDGKLANCYRV